jgi:hypothetical protein
MKKVNKRILGIVIIIICILFLFDIYIKKENPRFFEDVIEDHKSNISLMDSIGGFSSYEYKYNKNQLKQDTLDFKLILYGGNKKLISIGKAIKDGKKWRIIKQEINVQD